MFILYLSLVLMLITVLAMLSVPFWRQRKVFSWHFLSIALLVLITAGTLYYFSNSILALKKWRAQGQEHYLLQEQLQALGGIEGMISRIEEKLIENPDDAQGWFILGKLYLSKQDYATAAVAFGRAQHLKPENEQINYYYDMAKKAATRE